MKEKQIQVLSQAQIGSVSIPIYGSVEEPLFKAVDVAGVIEHTNPSVMVSVLEEDERPKYCLGRQGSTTFVTEFGLYEILFQSRKPIAKDFKKVVKGILKELRTKGVVDVRPKQVTAASAKAAMIFIKGAKDLLRLSDASVAKMYNKAAQTYGLPVPIEYVDSKGELLSLTDLLKKNNISISASAFNKILEAKGIIKRMFRKSRNGEKSFWSLIDTKYGENQVSPNNPRETQPLYYVNMFNELIKIAL